MVSRLERGRPLSILWRIEKMNRFDHGERALARVFDTLRSPLLLVLRLFIGWQFFVTGKGKLQNLDRVTEFFTSLHIPMPHLNAIFVGKLEMVGGLLLLVGLASRLIALPLTINMIVAYLTADREAVVNMFNNPDGFTHADPFLFLLVSLIVLAFGPGLFSLDELIARMRVKRPAVAAAALSGNIRRRLLLVRGVGVSGDEGRDGRRVGLHRRTGSKSDVRTGFGSRDGTLRIRSGD